MFFFSIYRNFVWYVFRWSSSILLHFGFNAFGLFSLSKSLGHFLFFHVIGTDIYIQMKLQFFKVKFQEKYIIVCRQNSCQNKTDFQSSIKWSAWNILIYLLTVCGQNLFYILASGLLCIHILTPYELCNKYRKGILGQFTEMFYSSICFLHCWLPPCIEYYAPNEGS